MSKKKKRNRPDNRSVAPTQPAGSEIGGLDEQARAARRAQQKAEWASQKKKETRQPITSNSLVWIGGLVGVVVIAAVGVFLLVSGGSGSGGPAGPTATPHPLAGLPIAKTIEVEAAGAESGSYFNPQQITGPVGEVIEIIVTNTGTVSHNLRVSGEDTEYADEGNPGDDWVSDPFAIKEGKTARVLVKIDKAGSYPFRCDFHPLDQVGTLILN